jgi:hypothetical protein
MRSCVRRMRSCYNLVLKAYGKVLTKLYEKCFSSRVEEVGRLEG